MTVRGFIAAAGIVVVATVGQACAHSGDVKEKQALTASLNSYASASVEVTVPNSVNNSAKVKTGFTDAVVERLRTNKVFADVPMTGGELIVRINVLSVDEGNKAMQAVTTTSGDAEIKATVDLYDTKESKVVGSFDVSGNSSNGIVTVGPDTRAISDTTAKACAAAADQVESYLDKHRGGVAAAKTPAPALTPSKDDDAKLQATFTESGQTAPTATATASTPPVAEAPPLPAAAPSSCPLVCFSANKGRVAPDDEARLSGQLSSILGALRTCGNGQSSLTMRFDSSATLTELGVDAGGNEGACVDAIRQQRPGVTYAGPATLRCSERCGGTTTTRKRRGR